MLEPSSQATLATSNGRSLRIDNSILGCLTFIQIIYVIYKLIKSPCYLADACQLDNRDFMERIIPQTKAITLSYSLWFQNRGSLCVEVYATRE